MIPPPVQGVIVQEITADHNGTDISCISGADVIAAHDGFATARGNHFMGNVVEIKGSNGLTTSYSHLASAHSVLGPVQQGQVIGYCGSTGRYSAGPHVHFESSVPFRFH